MKTVPDGVPGGMCPVSVKVAVAPAARLRIEQVRQVPVQMNTGPLFCMIETNVIVPGSVSVSETLSAALGPGFVDRNRVGDVGVRRGVPGPIF